MRGKLGVVLVGVGAFLLVAGLLVRFYAYPQLAVAPIDQQSVSTLVGPNATVFDVASLSEVQTDLTTTAKTVGDIAASKAAGDNVRVWVNSSSTVDSAGRVLSRNIDRVAFDAYTGEAVNCCGEYYETTQGQQTPVKHQGLVFKFPFRTEKKTYQFWDSSLLKAVPIQYAGQEQVAGRDTYRFEQTIPPTSSGTVDVPASVLGEPGKGNLQADRMYSNQRTLWVEPSTGVILKRSEAQDNYLAYNGERRVTTTKVTTGYTDETTKKFADEYGRLGDLLNLAYTGVPLTLLVLGLLLLVAGGVMIVGRRRREGRLSRRH